MSWKFQQYLPKIDSSSSKDFAVGPSQNLLQSISFETSHTINPQVLLNLLQLTAKDQKTGEPILLNGRDTFKADFKPHGVVPPSIQQVLLAEKGTDVIILSTING